MNKTLVSAFAILATASAFAATAFPDKDGSHDISSPAAWGGSIPSSGDVSFPAAGTYNANSGDVTFPQSIEIGSEGVTQVFDLTDKPHSVGSGKYWYCRKVGDGIADGVRLEPLVSPC